MRIPPDLGCRTGFDRFDGNANLSDFVDLPPDVLDDPGPVKAITSDGRHLALFEASRHGTRPDPSRPRGWRGDVLLYQSGTWERRWTASVDAGTTGDGRSLAEAGHEMGFFTELLSQDDETLACGSAKGCALFYGASDGKPQGRVRVYP